MPSEYYTEEDGKIVAKRQYSLEPLWSVEADSFFHRGPMGQDGYAYLVLNSFSHPFVPYISKTTGEPNGGCAICGWANSIHATITHVVCDFCDGIVDVDSKVVVSCDEKFEPSVGELDGRTYTISNYYRHKRFFCSELCSNRWLNQFKKPEEEE